MKRPKFYCAIEIWPKELEDAVTEYCSSVLKMTYEEKRKQILDNFREKLFESAIEYNQVKKEMSE